MHEDNKRFLRINLNQDLRNLGSDLLCLQDFHSVGPGFAGLASDVFGAVTVQPSKNRSKKISNASEWCPEEC